MASNSEIESRGMSTVFTMRVATAVPLAVCLVFGSLSGQSASPATRAQTFHIKGTITDPLEAVIRGVRVTFQSGQSTTTVIANGVGVYEADLPLGDYTMTVVSPGFRTYKRPLFRVRSPMNPTFDAMLAVGGGGCGDMIIVNSSGGAPTGDQVRAATAGCSHEDLFPIPSDDAPLELLIRFGNRVPSHSTYTYTKEKDPYQMPIFVAYNLFSLQANCVIYHAEQRTLEATGNVVIEDESGQHRADSISLKIENGRATPTP